MLSSPLCSGNVLRLDNWLVSILRRLRQYWYAAVLIPWVKKTAPSVNMFPDSGIDSGRTAATLVCSPASDVLMTSCNACSEIWTSRTWLVETHIFFSHTEMEPLDYVDLCWVSVISNLFAVQLTDLRNTRIRLRTLGPSCSTTSIPSFGPYGGIAVFLEWYKASMKFPKSSSVRSLDMEVQQFLI